MTIKSPTPNHILELGQAFRGAKALLSAVELDVFTLLADGPRELEDLSAQLGLNARGARDFLDTLVALGMLVRPHNGRYGNSAETDSTSIATSRLMSAARWRVQILAFTACGAPSPQRYGPANLNAR